MKNLHIVVGASSGYGLAIAKELSMVSSNRVVTAQRSLGINSIAHDVKSVDSWLNLEKFIIDNRPECTLKSIIYCTGIAADILPIGKKSNSQAIEVLETNINGLYHALELSARYMPKGGVFINIGSIAYRKNYFGGAEYCASKAAQTTLVRSARIEGIAKGVRYCTLNPGLGYTNFQKNRFGGDEEKAHKVTEGVRVLDPEDVAHAVMFMLSVPEHVCISEMEITPTEQAEHGEDIRKYREA
jgi:NADP-dependent 3-hydroxy acid dehydrogenase YdfG